MYRDEKERSSPMHTPERVRVLVMVLTLGMLVCVVTAGLSSAQDDLLPLAEPVPPPDGAPIGDACDTPVWPDALAGCVGSEESVAACTSTAAGASGMWVNLPVWIDTDIDLISHTIRAWTFTLTFDSDVLRFERVEQQNTRSENWDVLFFSESGQVTVDATSTEPLTRTGTLINLHFEVIGEPGTQTERVFSEFLFNQGDPPVTLNPGILSVISEDQCSAHPSPPSLSQVYLPLIKR
jgi:hypothetical protein